MPEVLDCVSEESTLGDLQRDVRFRERGQYLVNVTYMFFNCFAEDDDVVNIDETGFPFELGQYYVQGSLECAGRVGEPERHVDTLILSGVTYE